MKDNDLIIKKEVNSGLAYAIIFAVALILVFSMINYIKAKSEDISNGYVISENS